MNYFFMIVADRIDDTQRELVQISIEQSGDDWWHQFLDVWMVESNHTAMWWTDRLKVFTPKQPSSILIVKLADLGTDSWFGLSTQKKFQWLIERATYPQSDKKLLDDPKFREHDWGA